MELVVKSHCFWQKKVRVLLLTTAGGCQAETGSAGSMAAAAIVELLEIAGGLVADTPGFSSLDFDHIEREELPHYFIDMDEVSAMCKFRGREEFEITSNPKGKRIWSNGLVCEWS